MLKPLSSRYKEQVYSGVLGKIIGVYLGRPFEQWDNAAIESRLGEIRWYVHDKLGHDLIVADDDISGTFTFLRALEEHGPRYDITAEEIGKTWLNLLIDNRTVLWWGGVGMSAEHTAYARLKAGVPAPASGSMALNGDVMPQQIGGQIFIDGWGLVCPGEPDKAADLARRAASVSHDGEGIYGGMAVAAMVAAAFEESSVHSLMDVAVSVVPPDCLLRRVIDDVREWREADQDWRKTLRRIAGKWGYDQWPGGCHMLPNHAVIILALAYGEGSFDESMMVVNTAGYDTDCNSGNVGCILGVAGGLEPLAKWREPVADRMLIPTADSGRVISDAAREAEAVVSLAEQMRGEKGARPSSRFAFQFPGSVQGFLGPLENRGGGLVLPVDGEAEARAAVWIRSRSTGYTVMAAPTLYPGQAITAEFECPPGIEARLVIRRFDPAGAEVEDASVWSSGGVLAWTPAIEAGSLITAVAFQAKGSGEAVMKSLDWRGAPSVDFLSQPSDPFRHQWVNGADEWNLWAGSLAVVQNAGRGIVMTGTREWTDYTLRAEARTHLCDGIGLAVRVQGMRRYLAVVADPRGEAKLIMRRDEEEVVLAQGSHGLPPTGPFPIEIEVKGDRVFARVGEAELFGPSGPLENGGIALCVESGMGFFDQVQVRPVHN